MLDYILPIPSSPTHHIVDGSKLKRFMECPRAFFYEYLLGWRSERPNNHLVFGTAFHEALEHILLNGYTRTIADEAFEKFLTSYRTVFEPHTDELFEPKTPERAHQALRLYIDQYKKDAETYEVLFTEIAGRISIDDKRYLFFRMDSLVRERETDLIGSLEHKTGSRLDDRWRSQWDMSMQAGIYTHVLMSHYKEVFGVIFNGIFFKKVKDPNKWFDFGRQPVVRSESQMLTWWQNTVYWMDLLENEYKLLERCRDSDDTLLAFPLNTTACDKWFGCAYRDFCNAWANPLQKCARTPLGYIIEHWDPTAQQSKKELNV